jgi:hypothetical protein
MAGMVLPQFANVMTFAPTEYPAIQSQTLSSLFAELFEPVRQIAAPIPWQLPEVPAEKIINVEFAPWPRSVTLLVYGKAFIMSASI